MATHSSVLAWRIPRAGEPGGLPSMGSHRVGHDWSDLAAAAYLMIQFKNLRIGGSLFKRQRWTFPLYSKVMPHFLFSPWSLFKLRIFPDSMYLYHNLCARTHTHWVIDSWPFFPSGVLCVGPLSFPLCTLLHILIWILWNHLLILSSGELVAGLFKVMGHRAIEGFH